MPDSPDRPDLARLKTVSLSSRRHLVHRGQLGDATVRPDLRRFVNALPDLLASRQLKDLLVAIEGARSLGRSIVWGLGAHVIKAGCAPYVIALMERGFVTHLALNGAGVIHDFEMALAGATSEDVAESIRDGSFGMARETGETLGAMLSDPAAAGSGLGAHVGRILAGPGYPHSDVSLLAAAHRLGTPVSVHVALGTDVVHYHPACDWAALGRSARCDFDRFLEATRRLDGGGVYLNVGSAVLLPEVFLKAVSVIRNLGFELDGFTTAVLDMIDHYRPRENVLARPGGKGIRIVGHHEIMLPLIAGALLEEP